jgi:uncharacterized protein (TIGR00369 family)
MSSTMERVNQALVEEIFRRAGFVRSLGIELVFCGYGFCGTQISVKPELQQQHGFVHAGVLMTMADHTCGGAAASTMPSGKDVITVENNMAFLRPAIGETLFCRAQVLRSGKTLVFVEAEVLARVDGGEKLVAKGSSTLAVTPLRSTSEPR